MNNWQEILKAKGKLTSTSTIDLDELKPVPKRSNNSCNKKLKEYSEMLSERPTVFDGIDILSPKEYELDEGKIGSYGATFRKTKRYDDNKNNSSPVLETIAHKYTPIPEEVACKALSYFENSGITDDIQYRYFKDKSGKSWTIGWRVEDIFDDFLADEDDYFADASVMLVIFETNSNLRHHVHLSHRIILNEEFIVEEQGLIIDKLDWR